MSRAKILFIVLTMAFSSYGKAMRQFIDLSENAKHEMMQEFIQHFKDAELKLIKTRAEDVVYSRWSNRFSKNIFNALFLEDFYPSYLSVNCLTLKEERLKWYRGSYLSDDPKENGQLFMDELKGFYRPMVKLPSGVKLSFVKPVSSDEIISKINKWSQILSFKENEYEWLKKNCSSYVFQLVNSFAFHIEGEKLEQIEYDFSKLEKERISNIQKHILSSMNINPPITLTKKEATELIYVTALRCGIVKSLKEFNKKYIGKNIEFIIELTNPKCETEFGIMLYKASAK
jgi:hypothetical protein